MEQAHPPYCDDCLIPLTVKHVMAECPSYNEHRRRLFPRTVGMNADDALQEILSEKPNVEFHSREVIQYLAQCNLLDRI